MPMSPRSHRDLRLGAPAARALQPLREGNRRQIAEGYGLTEATCLVSCNPVNGQKKVGSVGVPLPYTHVRILQTDGMAR
jgi:long-subunit acyl-CoA synthetase (AMP-forming)